MGCRRPAAPHGSATPAARLAPPYGNFGQIATNDPRIPDRLGGWLRDRCGLVFVQEPARYAVPGDAYVPRLQLMAKTTGGELHDWLARGVDSRPR